MYNQDKLITILKESIGEKSLNEFARVSGVDSAYISRIINKIRTAPPSPKILEKLANASNGITTYMELMQICGYINYNENDLKEELEEKLNYYNLTEEEYTTIINCFIHDSERIQSLASVLKFSPHLQPQQIKKEEKVLLTIINYIFAFMPNDLEVSNDREKFYNEFKKALIPAKEMLLSLNKSKIINGYNREIPQYYMCPVYRSNKCRTT